MWQGRTNQVAKLWGVIGGQQTGEIQAGATVQGDAPLSSGYAYIRSPKAGYTKKIWLTGYSEIPVTPPPPPPPPSETPTLTHTIDIFSDGSIEVDGNPIP